MGKYKFTLDQLLKALMPFLVCPCNDTCCDNPAVRTSCVTPGCRGDQDDCKIINNCAGCKAECNCPERRSAR